MESLAIFILIFIIQQSLSSQLNSRVVLDMAVDPTSKILTIKNLGLVPINNGYIRVSAYVINSPISTSNPMGLYNAPGGNGSSFVALNPGASLRVDLKPDFKIENWQNSLTADTSNLYYCIRISFRNSITNEEMVHYMIVNAEIGVDVFGSDPDFPSGSSGSFKTEQALQVVQEEIFKNQELIHGDTKSEIY